MILAFRSTEWLITIVAHVMFLCVAKSDYSSLCRTFDFVDFSSKSSLIRPIINNPSHVLHGLLPPPTTAKQQYNLRRRPHDRQMPDHKGHLADKNFLIRILFKDSY